MKSYLKGKKGKRLGIIRAGMPKEVYFDAVLKSVEGEVVIFEDDDGNEVAVPIDKVLVAGPPENGEDGKEGDKKKAGFQA